jgi:hypothetical protein
VHGAVDPAALQLHGRGDPLDDLQQGRAGAALEGQRRGDAAAAGLGEGLQPVEGLVDRQDPQRRIARRCAADLGHGPQEVLAGGPDPQPRPTPHRAVDEQLRQHRQELVFGLVVGAAMVEAEAQQAGAIDLQRRRRRLQPVGLGLHLGGVVAGLARGQPVHAYGVEGARRGHRQPGLEEGGQVAEVQPGLRLDDRDLARGDIAVQGGDEVEPLAGQGAQQRQAGAEGKIARGDRPVLAPVLAGRGVHQPQDPPARAQLHLGPGVFGGAGPGDEHVVAIERRAGNQGVAVQQVHRLVADADGVQRIDHRLAQAQPFGRGDDLDAQLGQAGAVVFGRGEGLGQHQVHRAGAGQGLRLQLVQALGADRQEGRGQGAELGGQLLADQGAGHDQPDGHSARSSRARICSYERSRNSAGRTARSSM